MVLRIVCALLVYASSVQLQAATCLRAADLIALDRQYEEAIRVGDVQFLKSLLAEEYIWVHNLGVETETKAVLLQRLQDQDRRFISRVTRDASVHKSGRTAVVSGVSLVESISPDGGNHKSHYRFMRTYALERGRCKLLAVQTMKVWSDEISVAP